MSSGSVRSDSADASIPAPVAWGDAHPHSHLVQFYEDDSFLIDSLARWFADGLNAGDSCLYIGTDDHRTSLEQQLTNRGIDLVRVRAERRYVCLDAAAMLSDFMVDEWPNEALFVRTLEDLLATVSRSGSVRAFGEMVALLWKLGNRQAAIRLEEIWNAFMKTHALSLCCAYPMNAFGSDADS
ncbi:MAG TPA: MEDS domain-containing protein, partial [Candidatus Binatus sp.]|nr:MEDS domain-containing protein [Candidatus Binatus sp.]